MQTAASKLKKYAISMSRRFRPEFFVDDHTRVINVEAQEPGYVRRCGVALIDRHCEHDLMSRDFAKRLGYNISWSKGVPVSTTIVGETVQCLAEVKVRWHCEEKNIPSRHRFYFDRRFQDGTFLVIDSPNCFDVVVGSRTMEQLELSNGSRKLVAAFFRCSLPEVNYDTVSSEQAEADKKRKAEVEAMEREEERKAAEKRDSKTKKP